MFGWVGLPAGLNVYVEPLGGFLGQAGLPVMFCN